MYYELTDRFVVTADAQTTWSFFSAADNLPAITPSWLGFKILTPQPFTIQQDTLIDYKIKLTGGLPARWRTRIIDWSPLHQFIDLQIRGPYVLWHHQHIFTPDAAGTLCQDRVIYKLPMGPLGRVVHAALVRRQLMEIFTFRRQAISRMLGLAREPEQPVKIRKLI